MQRNLFKFVTLNSFKIVWAISVVLFTCVIANAQILQTGKDKAIATCIDSLRVVGFKPDSITVSFTTREPMSVKVHGLAMWVRKNAFTGTPAWLTADTIGNYDHLSDIDKKDHLFTIPVRNGTLTIGRKYLLSIRGSMETPSCDMRYPFTLYSPALKNLRLKGAKPKQ